MKHYLRRSFAAFLCAALILTVFPLQLTAFADPEPDPAVYDLTAGTPLELNIANAGDAVYVRFNPTETNRYEFVSTGSGDTQCTLYDAIGGTQLGFDDDSGVGSNFSLKTDLTAGTTYYFQCKYYRNGTGTFTVTAGIIHDYKKVLTKAPTATEAGEFSTVCQFPVCGAHTEEPIPAGLEIAAGETVTIPAGDPESFVAVTFTADANHYYRITSSDNDGKATLCRRYLVGEFYYQEYSATGTDRNFSGSDSCVSGKTYVYFCRPLADRAYKVTLTKDHDYTKQLTKAPSATEEGEFTFTCWECKDTSSEAIPKALVLTEEASVTVPAGDPETTVPVVFTPPVYHKYLIQSTDNGGVTVSCRQWTLNATYDYQYSGGGENNNLKILSNYNEGYAVVLFCKPNADHSYTLSVSREHSFSKKLSKLPTPTENGAYTYKCDYCDESYDEPTATAVEIRDGETITLTGESDSGDVYVWFAPTAYHYYTLTSSEYTGGDPFVYLYNAGAPVYIDQDDDSGEDRNFSIGEDLEQGRSYVFLCKISKGASYKVTMSSDHVYEKKMTKIPTAAETGLFTYSCKFCDSTYTEVIPKALEIEADATVTIPAGEADALCPVVFTPRFNHQYLAKSAENNNQQTACTLYIEGDDTPETFNGLSYNDYTFSFKQSYTAGKACIFFCKQNPTNAYKFSLTSEHDYTSAVTKLPTLTAGGEISDTCKNCRNVIKKPIGVAREIHLNDTLTLSGSETEEYVYLLFKPTATHTYIIESSDYTSGDPKVELYYQDGATITKQAYNDDGGSSWNFKLSSKLLEGGNYVFFCRIAADATYKVTLTATHDYTKMLTKAPTATETGLYTYTCTDGDDSYTEAIPKGAVINPGQTVTIPAGDGSQTYPVTFRVPKTHRYRLEAAGNDGVQTACTWSTVNKAGSSTANVNSTTKAFSAEFYPDKDDTIVFFCKRLEGKSYTVTLTEKHSYQTSVTRLPTLTAAGEITHSCIQTGCTESYTEPIDKAVQIREDETLQLTGKANRIYAAVLFTPTHSHRFVLESLDKSPLDCDPNATLYEAGNLTSLSANDDGAGSHNFELPFDLTAGKTYVYLCRINEGESYKVELTSPHNYTKTLTKAPTATATGLFTYSCTACSDTYTEVIPKALEIAPNEIITIPAGDPDTPVPVVIKTTLAAHNFTLNSISADGAIKSVTCWRAGTTDSWVNSGTTASPNWLVNFSYNKEYAQYVFLCKPNASAPYNVTLSMTHNQELFETKMPTTTEEGYFRYKCQNCEYTTTEAIPKAIVLEEDTVLQLSGTPTVSMVALLFTPGKNADYRIESLRSKKATPSCNFYLNGDLTTSNYYSGFSFEKTLEAGKTSLILCRLSNGQTYSVKASHIHKYVKTTAPAPTCTADGTAKYTCSVCGTYYTLPMTKRHTDADSNGVCDVCGKEVVLLDVAFAIDTTGSMGANLAQMRKKITDALDVLDNAGVNYRMAIVDYRDFSERSKETKDYPYRVGLDFTKDPAAIVEGVNSLTLGNGGDAPETVYSALINGLHDLSWSPVSAKTVLLIGDARPHDPEPFTNLTMNTVKLALLGVNTTIEGTSTPVAAIAENQVIQVNSITTGSNTQPLAQFAELSDATGGTAYAGKNTDVGEIIIGIFKRMADGQHFHTPQVVSEGSAATCTAPGSLAKIICSSCGLTLQDAAVIPALGHLWENRLDAKYLKSAATETSPAIYYKSCARCGLKGTETFESGDAVPHTTHTWTNKVDAQYLKSAATCTAKAVYYKSCSFCGIKGTATFESGNTLGHSWTNKVDAKYLKSAATCTAKAIYYKSCSRCGAKGTETFENGNALGHSWTNKVDAKYLKTAATCTAKAVYYKSCSRCGAKGTETFENGNALGHSWTNKVDAKYLKSAATCTAKAIYYKSCSRCGAKGTETFENGNALGHKQTYTKTADTHTLTCSVCKKELEKAQSHTFGKGTLKKAPAGKTLGEMVYKCSVCGYEKTQTFLLGDVDLNGKIEAADARLALRLAVGLETFEAGTIQFIAADADHSGKSEASDARLILRAAVGLEELK